MIDPTGHRVNYDPGDPPAPEPAPPTGGPAFPTLSAPDSHGEEGMTLRDYFAAHALAVVATYPAVRSGSEAVENSDAARWAYQIADAMLAAREVDT